jgi:hypothetical protein
VYVSDIPLATTFDTSLGDKKQVKTQVLEVSDDDIVEARKVDILV